MTPSNQELADEQLDAFLEELDADTSPQSTQSVVNEQHLDCLLEEIIELTKGSSPRPAAPSLPTLPVIVEKKKKSKSLIWIAAALLIGLFAGCAFGFFWAKGEGVWDKPILEPQGEITTQISYWIDKLNTLYEKLEQPEIPLPESEIIEPAEIRMEIAPSEIVSSSSKSEGF